MDHIQGAFWVTIRYLWGNVVVSVFQWSQRFQHTTGWYSTPGDKESDVHPHFMPLKFKVKPPNSIP